MSEYSRVSRRQQREKKEGGWLKKSVEIKEGEGPSIRPLRIKVPIGFLLLASLLISVFSVANPLLTFLADSSQSQYLYGSQAMLAGQTPYLDFYTSQGLIYYLIGILGNLLGTTIILALGQAVALYFSGATFYKMTVYLTGQKAVGQQLLWFFYLILASFGFGGLYAPIFAFPFLLKGLWFLLRYFDGGVSDESFIWYGINGALVFLIDPKAALLWLVAGFLLLIYNIRRQAKARGFYQFLATFFGFSLVIYLAGYYTVLHKNFGQAIEQTFLYQIEELSFGHAGSLHNILYVLVFLAASGLLTSLIYGAIGLGRGGDRNFKILLYLMFVIHLVESLASPSFSTANLIILIPFGLLLTGTFMANNPKLLRRRDAEGEEDLDFPHKSYLRINTFLPLLTVAYLVAYPVWFFLSEGEIRSERQEAVTYIRDNSQVEDKIYAWDSSAHAYLDSQRWAAAQLITPDTYLANQDNRDNLVLDLGYDRAKFVLVKQSQTLEEGVTRQLADRYQEVNLDLKHFKLYQIK